MADRTLEARNGRQETAGAEAAPVPNAPAAVKTSGLSNPWLPLVVTLVSMPLLAYGVTKFVLLPEMKKALTASAAAPADSGTEAKEQESAAGTGTIEGKNKVTVPLNKLLVNVAGTMGTRYLMTSLTLVGTDPNLKNKIDENRDQLMDLATSALSTKTISDLEKPGARNVIRAELLTAFNSALGGPLIKEIYITELAIQ
ncbi:MAG: flagellar basal body-associated FliL family protein [Verrucomicrobiota bacterium]|jgi:flagellar FliL protein